MIEERKAFVTSELLKLNEQLTKHGVLSLQIKRTKRFIFECHFTYEGIVFTALGDGGRLDSYVGHTLDELFEKIGTDCDFLSK